MPRPVWFRTYSLASIAIAAVATVWSLVGRSWASTEELLFFAVLVAVAKYVDGFEAAVVFGAIAVTHDPAVAFAAVSIGAALQGVYRDAAERRARMQSLHDAAELALSYGVVAILYTSAVARDAPVMARVSGTILLLVGYVAVNVGFAAARRMLEGAPEPLDVRGILLAHTRIALLVTPIVAAEVIGYSAYGMAGFSVGFLPVLLIAYAMQSAAEARRENVELARRNRELSILTESATHILSAEGDEETLRRTVTLVGRLARLKACAVVTWGTSADVPGVYRFGACHPSDQEILRWVESAGFEQSAPNRAFVFRNEQRRFPLSEGSAIQMLLGIQTEEVIYGILIYETEEAAILKSGSLNLLMLLVNQTAVSLQDQLLRREMAEKNVQLVAETATKSMILDVANGLIATHDVDDMLERIAQAVRTSIGFDQVVFALYDPRRDEFIRRAHAGLDDVWEEMRKKPVPSGEISPFFEQEFRVLNSFFVSHTALQQSERGIFIRPADDPLPRADEWHENDLLITPLMSGEEMSGYLAVRNPNDRRVPTIQKVQTLEIFAVQAVTALQSARQYEEIKRLTFVDGMTPAFNYRYFQETLAKEIHRHSRTGHEFALAMLDIDEFKRINDTFGHPAGDEVLKGLVEELLSNARDTDVVARYGGEEFAIIFPDTPLASARDAANRMRELIERREFALAPIERSLRITVSIGVAVYPHDGSTATDLVSRADAALYAAKKAGKNRVALASGEGNAVEVRSS